MAMIVIEGGEARLAQKNWTGTPNTFTAGRCGGTAWRASATNVAYNLPVVKTEIIIGFGFFWGAAATGNILDIFGPLAGPTNAHITFRVVASGTLEVYRGASSGTLLQAIPVAFQANAWHFIEFKLKVNDASGVIEVKIDGTVVYTFAGDTCAQSSETTINMIRLGTVASSFYDDFYMLETAGAAPNSYLGDVAVETLFPNNNGTTSQLVGSDGNSVNNYQQVDEVPAVIADYNGSATVNQKDTYALTDLIHAVGTVIAVQTQALCLKSDAGAANMKIVERVAGVERDSTSQALTASPGSHIDGGCNATDPSAAAWTIASVNAMEAGVKVA